MTVVDVLNDFETDGAGRYKLPNLRASSPLEIVVRMRVPSQSVGVESHLADFELTYVEQETKALVTIVTSFRATFDTAEVTASLTSNPDVISAVRLLMNARARLEAMERMDRGDFAFAQAVLRICMADTDVAFALWPLHPDLQRELTNLRNSARHWSRARKIS